VLRWQVNSNTEQVALEEALSVLVREDPSLALLQDEETGAASLDFCVQ
jgi:hypothetical protein